MQRSKILSYIGFAKKSGNLRTGVNGIAATKGACLLILCSSAAQNTVAEAEKLARKFGCPLAVSYISVEEITGKSNCKLMALTDKELAGAIIQNIKTDENFTLKSGGCKE